MNKKILILLSAIFFCLFLNAQDNQRTAFFNLNTPVTALAASSTNTSNGTIFPIEYAQTPIRIWVSASGVAADSDGSGALTVKISSASGNAANTNLFDTAAFSSFKLVLSNGVATATAAAPAVKSDWFVTSGVRYMRVGQMENSYTGALSNIVVTVGFEH